MKRKNKPLSAFLSCLMFANIGLSGGLPVLATEIFAGGQDGFGAQINDLGGANINYNTGTEAQIGITGNGNVIKWDHLNVGAGNKLDYNFTQSGQVAVNKVIGGVSKFAGTVSTSGENGHLIISNPNGMVFMNGSVVNVDTGSATFTTHDVTWDGQKNGNITTNANGTNKGITIGGGQTGPVPVIRVNKDLNIIAPGVDVSGADLFAGGTVRMISTDGVNFVAGANSTTPTSIALSKVNPASVQYARVDASGKTTYTSANSNAINVLNTNVCATKSYSVDGHLYLVADGNIALSGVNTGSLTATSAQNITIADTRAKDTVLADAGKSIKINNLTADKNVRMIANDSIDAKNIIAGGTIWALNAKDVNAKSLTANEIYLGTTTKAVGGKSYNETWHNEWNAGAQNVVAEDINATLALNIFSKDKLNVKNITSGGDITLNGNNITASDIKVTGQLDRPWGEGNKTIGLSVQKQDDGTTGGVLDLKNVESAVATIVTGFGTAKIANVISPIFMAESIKNLVIDNLKTDNLFLSALYANWFGIGGAISAVINGLSALSGDTVAINKAFDINTFDKAIDDARDYPYNMLVLDINDYLNMSFNEKSNLLPVMFDDALTSLTIANSDANIDLGRISSKNGATVTTAGDVTILGQKVDGNLTVNAGDNIFVDGLNSNAEVKLTANDTIDIKNITTSGTVKALNAENIIADTIKGNLVLLGGRTKGKAQPGMTVGNSAWYEEWNPYAKSIIATNIEADLDLRLLSTDKVVANNLTAGGDIYLLGNNVNASNISVTDEKIREHYPSTNRTIGLIAETYDSWASSWGLASNGGKNSTLTLSNVNIDDKAAAVMMNAFETVDAKNIAAPMLIVESAAKVSIDGLKVDDMHFSNIYYMLLGDGFFDLENVSIKNLACFTQGGNITLNQSFNPDNFDVNLDKNYGYEHNLLALQYLNGDYDKVANKANNTNLAPVNYVDGISYGGSKVTFGEQPDDSQVTPEATPGGPANINTVTNNQDSGPEKVDGDWSFYKVDEDIDTVFRKQFKPKGFAATDEEIAEMKREAAVNTLKGEGGLLKIMKEFRAY